MEPVSKLIGERGDPDYSFTIGEEMGTALASFGINEGKDKAADSGFIRLYVILNR